MKRSHFSSEQIVFAVRLAKSGTNVYVYGVMFPSGSCEL
jgi:hypothetical protein